MAVPCGLTPDMTVCTGGVCCPGASQFDPDLSQAAQDMAVTNLWALTGRRFGACPVTVRPCRQCRTIPLPELIMWNFGRRDNLGVGFGWYPMLDSGTVFNISCGACTSECRCEAKCEFFLPGPIDSINEIRVDGNIVDPSKYVVYDKSKLVFLTGVDCPETQNYNLALSEVGTWSVDYNIGEAWPAGAAQIAGLLACEYGRAFTSDPGCNLPARVQSVARQGVDVQFVDPFALADAGLTGLPVVDSWIRAQNPYKLAARPRVWSPDLPVNRRET